MTTANQFYFIRSPDI